jgi:outer membrane lipoprotein-sorting protein
MRAAQMTAVRLLIMLIIGMGVSHSLKAAPLAIVDEALSTEELRELQGKLNRRASLAVDFVQTRTSALRPNRPSVSSGKAIFAKPAKFRWVIEKPQADILIFDGVTIFNYKPADKIVSRFKTEGGRAKEIKEIIDFVLNFDELLKRYKLEKAVKIGQLITLSLIPKIPGQVTNLNITVDAKDYFVAVVSMIFVNKNTSEIQFSNPIAGKVDAKAFATPEGLTVVDGF